MSDDEFSDVATINSDSDIVDDYESVDGQEYEYVFRGTRRWHATSNPYPLPNDDYEVELYTSLEIVMKVVFEGKSIMVPMRSNPQAILDCGTGSGNWAIEVAQVYPFAEVIGMDISPVTPQAPIPTNCRFVKGDVTDDLPSRFGNGRFDLVHSRGLMGGVYETAWDRYIRDIYEILIPDHGHAQIIEFSLPKWANGSLPPNSALAEYYSLMAEGHRRRGTISSGGSHLQQRMRNAGFVDIQVTAKYVAVGDWPGEAKTVEEANFRRATSRCFFENVRDLVEDQPIFKEAYPSRVERKKFADRVWEECYVGRYPLYIEVWMVAGRKPPFNWGHLF